MKYYVTSNISENIHETPEGFLICLGVPIARVGEMVYGPGETPIQDKAGKVLITREEKEVFRPQTLASFEGKPVTISHPNEFVNPDNWKDLAKGVLQNVRRGEGEFKDDLIADLLITDKMAIALVKNGLREVSCGYEADYVQTEEGKGFQKNIIGNHLALVDQGRAGPGYAINDHKGDMTMTIKEKIKAIFAKAQDEAMAAAADEDKAKDADKDDDKKDEKAKDAGAYDELVQMVKDLGEKISSMAKPKDEAPPKKDDKDDKAKDADKDDDKEEKAKDDAGSMEDRMKALEAAVSKLLEKKTGDEDETDDADEDDETDDDDFDNSSMVGDTMSRAEILAPGLKKSKDIKEKALKSAYDTTEGKKVIDSLTGGKAPTYDSKEKVDALFIAASEVLKAARNQELVKSKTKDFSHGDDSAVGAITAEKLNEINDKHYKKN